MPQSVKGTVFVVLAKKLKVRVAYQSDNFQKCSLQPERHFLAQSKAFLINHMKLAIEKGVCIGSLGVSVDRPKHCTTLFVLTAGFGFVHLGGHIALVE